MSDYRSFSEYETPRGEGLIYQFWDNVHNVLERGNQLFRSVEEPRQGLTPGQNAYLDLSGWDDRLWWDPNTDWGRDVWFNELTQVRPRLDKFRRNPVWRSMVQQDGLAWVADQYLKHHDNRFKDSQFFTELGARQGMQLGAFRLGKLMSRAVRLNRFNTSSMANFAITLRASPHAGITNVTKTGRALVTPYIQTPNLHLTSLMHERVYGYHRTQPQIEDRQSVVPDDKTRKALAGYKPSEMVKDPRRMTHEEYIEWLRTPVNEQHRKAIGELYKQYVGDLGNHWEASPLSASGLVRPDERSDATEKLDVPRRMDASSGPSTLSEHSPTYPQEGPELGSRPLYDRAATMHVALAGSQAEAERIQAASAMSWYRDQFGEKLISKLMLPYRMEDTKLSEATLEEYRKEPSMQPLMRVWDSDESVGAQLLRRGRIPNRVDLSDFESIMFWQGGRRSGKSKIWEQLRNGDYGSIPWVLKPAKYRRIGYNAKIEPPDPKQRTYNFDKQLYDWRKNTGQYIASNDPGTDFGATFEYLLQSGRLEGDYASIQELVEARPEMRDMFFNPYDGNVANMIHLITRADGDLLRDLEELKLARMQRQPYQSRFTKSYPLVRTPHDVIIGPTMQWMPEGQYLESHLNNPQTHLEIQRVADTFYDNKKTEEYASIINSNYRELLVELGMDDADEVMYDPYRHMAYDKDIVQYAAAKSLQPFYKALQNVTNTDRRESLEVMLQGAQERLVQKYMNEMVGPSKSRRGVEVLLNRLWNDDAQAYTELKTPGTRRQDTKPGQSPYYMSNDFYSFENEAVSALKNVPEFSNVTDVRMLSQTINPALASYSNKMTLGDEALDKMAFGNPEEFRNEMFTSNNVRKFLEAGNVVMPLSPVAFEHPTNAFMFMTPGYTPLTAGMMSKSMEDAIKPYALGKYGDVLSENAIIEEDLDSRQTLNAPMYAADLSLSNMIQSAIHSADAYGPRTNADVLEGTVLKDVAGSKFFDGLREDRDQLHQRLRRLIPSSRYKANMQILGHSASEMHDDLVEYMDGQLWPQDLYVMELTMPDDGDRWNSLRIANAYQDAIRNFFLKNPEVMEVNLMKAYDDALMAAQSKSPSGSVRQIDQVLTNLITNIMPNYEAAVGQDPMTRSRLAYMTKEIDNLNEDQTALALPEIIKDIKAVILHMKGNFGSMHDGMMWQTALRAAKLPTETQAEVQNYIQGYTQNYLETSNAIFDQMTKTVRDLAVYGATDYRETILKSYNVSDEDISTLTRISATVDRPIRMDPGALALSGRINSKLQGLHQKIQVLQKDPKQALTSEIRGYLRGEIQGIEALQEELMARTHEHYYDSLFNLASDPDVTRDDISMYFQTQSTAMNTIADNPAALALAKSLTTSDDLSQVRQNMNQLRAQGILTKKEFKGLQMLIDVEDISRQASVTDMLFDLYAAHDPNLPTHVIDHQYLRMYSKYGPPMKKMVEMIRDDPKVAEAFVAKILADERGNPLSTLHRIQTMLGIGAPSLPEMFSEYDASARNFISLLATSLRSLAGD